MSTPTITEEDEAILDYLAESAAERADVAAAVGLSGDEAADRLDGLVDGGLVRESGGTYEITDSGERLLASPGDGTTDAGVDTPPAVDEAIAEMDLAPDHAEALEEAFAFLRHWGAASSAEVIDAVYSENPLGYASADDWWAEAIRDRLAALPEIERDGDAWRHAGGGAVDDGDGRRAFTPAGEETYGSVKHALESLDVDAQQREAVTAVFEHLQSHGGASEDELQELARDAADVEASAGTWWRDAVAPVLRELPGVDRANGRWQYSGDHPE